MMPGANDQNHFVIVRVFRLYRFVNRDGAHVRKLFQRLDGWIRRRMWSHRYRRSRSLDRRVYLDDITRNRILGTAVKSLKALPLRSENRPVFHGGYP